jgi:hypothetical protein
MKKHFTAHIIFAVTALTSQQVWALGFGRAVSDAVLGQAFTFTVPVHVDAGERFGLDCMSADVYYGEEHLQPAAVRTELERGTADNTWVVRITASVPVGEPIVEVALSAGCERRFMRRFTVFADPPTVGGTAARLPPAAGGTVSPAATALPSTAAATDGTSNAGGARSTRHQGNPGNPPTSGRTRAAHKGPTLALARELDASAAAATARPVPDAGSARKPGPRVAAPVATPRLVLDGGYSHLKLDLEDPIIPAAAGASGAAIGLSDLDDPDARQLKALEQSIQAVKRESQAQHDAAAKLQSQLAEAQSRNDWMPWIFGLLAVALAAIAALAWRLRQQAKAHQSAWFNEAQASAQAPLSPMPASVVSPPVAQPPADLRDIPAIIAAEPFPQPPALEPDAYGALGTGVVSDLSATRPLDRRALAGLMAQQDSAPRELSVEELLDLEQQADFFIALGQEDAAVDLLMSHLRSAGGQSPLPYTKLLEIYRRQGDRSAYERTRARFNRRFNAYAPDWDTGPGSGRLLEDYPDTVAMVQNAWASPIDAMAILEGLLFKRDDTSELFDLPAYRDVLVLYSLARDLWQHGGGSTSTQVDVLLPIDDSDFAAQVPYPSARQVNDPALPATTDDGMLTSFAMPGFENSGGGAVDFELPASEALFNGHDDGAVHATLDTLSLDPIAPVKPKPDPLDWDDSVPPDSERPTKR